MNARSGWFEVDRAGLARVASRRSKVFILRELIQNAWDTDAATCRVEVLPPAKGSGFSTIIVEDDSSEGFADISHAYTLFAKSVKLGDVSKRGRFNFGEKLVLSLCSEARVETMKGTILFDRGETRRRSPKKTERGSRFVGMLKLNASDRDELLAAARAMIVPEGKQTFVNGDEVEHRVPVSAKAEAYLDTEIAGDDGVLRKDTAWAKVGVYDPLPGEKPYLYEMGIPVVALEGDRWHVDVEQKVPLNMERDNVSPTYLRTVRSHVANAMREHLTVEDANAPWARDALTSIWTNEDTVKTLVELRFGDKVVAADPSDPEATNKAVAEGYVVVHGGQLSGSEWSRVKDVGVMKPAGQVFPTPRPFSPDGSPLKTLDPAEWSKEMIRFEKFAKRAALAALDRNIAVAIANDQGWSPEAAFGPGGTLYLNLVRLGRAWFYGAGSEAQIDLLIHEFGHNVEGNHLSERYHEALCRIGAKIARLAVESPEVFDPETPL